jgi:hypothetical protein
MIAVLAVAIGQGRSPWVAMSAWHHTPAGGAHELRSRRSAIRREATLTVGGLGGGGPGVRHSQGALLVGGPGGALHVTLLP